MNKKYKVEKEYSLLEIVQYNLKMWWLAAIFALAFAAILGIQGYQECYPYLEEVRYGNIQQVRTNLYINAYSEESAVERVNTIVKMANSNKVYQQMIDNTGYDLNFETYQEMFDFLLGETSNVVSIYVSYPVNYGDFVISDEETAKEFLSALVQATDEVTQEIIGEETLQILDEPYATIGVEKTKDETITSGELKSRVIKTALVGAVLGVLIEVILYTLWLLNYKKPKNVEEIRQCIDAPVIDVLKKNAEDETAYKKVALFMMEHDNEKKEKSGRRVNCINLQCTKRDAALKLAMSYAGEKKKTLLVDLVAEGENTAEKPSISSYVLGEGEMPKPIGLKPYLDTVCRNEEDEKGFDIVTNNHFEEYLLEKSKEYEYIVVGSKDVTQCVEGYAVAKLCEKNILVCERKNMKNKALYEMKNTVDVNNIQIDGILVYE